MRTQGKSDQQRAKLYGKIGKQIAQAARKGGVNPLDNSRLKELMEVARAAQVCFLNQTASQPASQLVSQLNECCRQQPP